MIQQDQNQDREIHKNIAETILKQIGGHNRLKLMIGANNFQFDQSNLTFRYMKADRNNSNYVDIKLMESDTYTLTFWNIRGHKCKIVQTIEGVYADNLASIFSDATGLDLAIPKIFPMSC